MWQQRAVKDYLFSYAFFSPTYFLNLCISGPTQFKSMLFKGQLYYYSTRCGKYIIIKIAEEAFNKIKSKDVNWA